MIAGWTCSAWARFMTAMGVATWNIYYLSKDEKNKREPDDYKRLRQIADSLESDVIALQEVDHTFVEKVFDPALYHLELSGRSHVQKTGLAIRRGIQYERKADVTALNVGHLRYGTHIELQIGSHRIDVLSIHLKSGCFSHKEDEDSKAQDASEYLKRACRKLTEQVPILEEWIDSQLKDGRALIVLGDFNRRLMIKNDCVWRELADGEPEPIMLATTQKKKQRCWGSRYPEFIDYILIGPKMAQWLSGSQDIVFREAATKKGFKVWKERLSDHCPLKATFNIEE